MKWTKQHDARLLELINSGETFLSAAHLLNQEWGETLSRSAIAGRFRRVGPKRSAPNRKRARKGPTLPKSNGVSILDLQYWHCRSVSGHGEDGLATFCGAHKTEDSSYCPEHKKLYIYTKKDFTFQKKAL